MIDDKFLFYLGSNNIYNIDSDNFFIQIYDFFNNKGFIPIIVKMIAELLSIFFGIAFSSFIFIFLDWDRLLLCGNNNCDHISEYIKYGSLNFFQIYLLIISILYFGGTIGCKCRSCSTGVPHFRIKFL